MFQGRDAFTIFFFFVTVMYWRLILYVRGRRYVCLDGIIFLSTGRLLSSLRGKRYIIVDMMMLYILITKGKKIFTNFKLMRVSRFGECDK